MSIRTIEFSQLDLVLDTLSSQLVVLNQFGTIVYVNRAWKQFADNNGLAIENYGIGCQYLDYCDGAEISSKFFTSSVDQGIKDVMDGSETEYTCRYCCHSHLEEKWFQMKVTPFYYQGSRYSVIIHEQITTTNLSEKRLWDILENAPIGMAIVTLDGIILNVNQSLSEMLGYKSLELNNFSCKQISHPDDLHKEDSCLQGLLNGEQISYCIKKRLFKKNGDIIWVNLTCSSLRDITGKPSLLIKQIQDITEIVKTESLLHSKEYRLDMVLNHVPALIGYWNKDLINEFGNNLYIDWFGINPAQIKGMHLREVIGEQLFEQNLPYVENVLKGIPQFFERMIKDVSGNDLYTLASYVPDFYEETVNGFFVLVTDISQVKKAEDELLKSQQLSKLFLDTSIDGFCFLDLYGNYLDVNLSFCRTLGYTRDEILNMSITEIEDFEDVWNIKQHLKKIMEDGFDRFETKHKHKNGKQLDVEVSITYLTDKQQFFAFIRDISQRKQSEQLRIEQLEQQRDALIREVHHRIKNHLQGMVGLLGVLSYKNTNEKELIQHITAKITSIAIVYGIQSKGMPGSSYLCEITLEICKCLMHFGENRIEIKPSIDSGYKALIPTEYAVPIALIINELVMNGIKHSCDLITNEVNVELSFTENTATITVSNNCKPDVCLPDFNLGLDLGVGLTLVKSLLPKKAATLTFQLHQRIVQARLTLASPVINLHSV